MKFMLSVALAAMFSLQAFATQPLVTPVACAKASGESTGRNNPYVVIKNHCHDLRKTCIWKSEHYSLGGKNPVGQICSTTHTGYKLVWK